jgi:hypothetical protein
MKALSIIQPWPWLMFHGTPLKDIENRTWPLPRSMRGQRVAIHASGRRDLDECWKASALINATPSLSEIHFPPIRLAFRGRGFIVRSWPSELATSAIIGTVEIVDCVTASDSPWFAGPYGFVLRDPRPLAEPIPCRGWLGFWTVPSEIERQILEAERRAA